MGQASSYTGSLDITNRVEAGGLAQRCVRILREAVSCLVLECQQLPHRQLTLVLSFEDLRGISLKTLIPSDFSVQNQVMYSNLLPPLDGQMQTAVSHLVYKASLTLTHYF